jgi:iron-sulfur cluster repair protein YtfE (RIC family)
MDFDRMLAELFAEDDRARAMAARLLEIAASSEEAAAGERASLLEFLRGPMERHMAYEERVLFPALKEHGLAEEVGVAAKQHEAVRTAARQLELAGLSEVATVIAETARVLLCHTNFEGDYIYPELTHDEWRDLMRMST